VEGRRVEWGKNYGREIYECCSISGNPWLRGTRVDIAAVPRAVLHAFDLAGEDLGRFCGGLTDAELDARPCGLPPVAFHIRHIARSVDRLLTYAEGKALSSEQMAGFAVGNGAGDE